MPTTEWFDTLVCHDIAPTPQRLQVAAIMLEKPQHLSAEQIIQRLRAEGSTVSKATVYNTLNLFAEKGLVRELTVDPERCYYDSTTAPHHHFYNVDSGELTDLDDADIAIGQLPELPEGTTVDSIEILVKVRNR